MTDAVIHYFAMGGYADFVWPAYGISAAVMIAVAMIVFRDLKGRERALQALRAQLGQDSASRSS